MNTTLQSGQRILVVDDVIKNIQVIGTILREEGYLVSIADNGEKALNITKKKLPDLILLDIMMPEMDGFATCRLLKADPTTRDIPIIFLTGLTDTGNKVHGFRCGAVDYVTKPVEPAELLARIKTHLTIKTLQKELESANANLEEKVLLRTSELKQTNRVLRQSEERFRDLTENTTDLIWEMDEKGIYTYASPKCFDLLGYPPREMIGRTPFDFMPEEDQDLMRGLFREITASRQSFTTMKNIMIHRNGSRIMLETSGVPVHGANGNFKGYRGIDRDVTKRYQAEKEMHRLRHLLGNIINSMPSMLAGVDRDERIIFWNATAATMTGISGRQAKGRRLGDILPQLAGQLAGIRESIDKGEVRKETEVACSFGGKTRFTDITIYPLIENKVKGAVIHIDDKSEQVEMEREREKLKSQLRQSQKMEAMGTLASGIAHDFNNILAAIIGIAELIREQTPADSPTTNDVNQVLVAADRAKNLVRQILSFSRQSDQKKQPIVIRHIVKEALRLLRSSIPTTIEIRQQIAPDCGMVHADPTEIHQIIMNLCTNAYHAMRERGGILAVSINPVIIDEKEGRLGGLELESGMYVKLEISDTGHGMPAAVLARIFDPYFTTKKKDEGTGLGLAVVHGIVRSHGGDIVAFSEPERGSTFQVYLPRLAETAPEKRTRPLPVALGRGNEHILLVDDEAIIVSIANKILKGLGYRVSAFTGSPEALEAFKAAPRTYDLVITDMTMPSLTGAQLAKEMLAVRPTIPIILCTGFSELINEQEAKELGIREYIMKPILKEEMARAVRRVLDGTGTGASG